MVIRIILNISLLISILFLPWWVSILLGILILFLYKFYEIIIWGIFADSLYASIDGFFGIQFIFTLTFTFLFLISILMKKRIIFYNT